MKAKYPGFCPKCKQRFVVNQFDPSLSDEITKDEKLGKWVHSNCSYVKQYEASQKSLVGHTYQAGVNTPKLINNFDENALDAALETISSEQRKEDQPKKQFKPTAHQQAIYDFISDPVAFCLAQHLTFSLHAVVEAVAGSGKTTTILNALSITPQDAQVAFVAFNTHIAKTLKQRAPAHVFVSTLHSLGNQNLKQHIKDTTGKYPEIDTKGDKLSDIFEEFWPVSKAALQAGLIDKKQRSLHFAKRLGMRSLVSLAKSILVDANNHEAVYAMIDRYSIDIDTDFVVEAVERLPYVLQKCLENTETIDFDDMLWMPIALNIDLQKFDYLFVDEAQDLNQCQIQFVLRSIAPEGRVIAVGDRNQSLYAFRGADSNAIPNIIEALSAITLPLSITFRCPASHVRMAQKIVPQIQARDNAPEGEILELAYFSLVQSLHVGDIVACRTNGPLVRPAFECIRRGMKAVIRGKDIGASLVQTVRRFGTDDLASFDVALGEYYENEYRKLIDKGKEMQALQLEDKVKTLRAIMSEVNSVPELINKIQMLFDDGAAGVVFTSVHKVKGLETETEQQSVFLLRPDLMPHPKAKSQDDMQQELNCLYVAITRSKNKLYIVLGDENGPMKGELYPVLKDKGGEVIEQ